MHNESIPYRIRIEGSYKGTPWVYEDPPGTKSSFYWPEDNDPSDFWWRDGNMSCDCNRTRFLPANITKDWTEDNFTQCGGDILIKRIIPIDDSTIPILELNEEE